MTGSAGDVTLIKHKRNPGNGHHFETVKRQSKQFNFRDNQTSIKTMNALVNYACNVLLS